VAIDESSYGIGPGSITPDGCAVEVYLQLPPNGEPEIIDRAIAAGSRILDLGCGTGRLSNPLAGFGHHVVAVDESADMLAHLTGAVPVHTRIEDLALDELFDVVLLASHLINNPSAERRHAFLQTCRRHAKPTGQVLVQWHPPEWFDTLAPGVRRDRNLGPLSTSLHVLAIANGLLTAEASYWTGDSVWTQRFIARRLTDQDLVGELRTASLELRRWLDPERRWLAALPLT
jgi:SAM-dependent methyltransferase